MRELDQVQGNKEELIHTLKLAFLSKLQAEEDAPSVFRGMRLVVVPKSYTPDGPIVCEVEGKVVLWVSSDMRMTQSVVTKINFYMDLFSDESPHDDTSPSGDTE